MDRTDTDAIAAAIARLDLWQTAVGRTWAVTLETEGEPFIVHVGGAAGSEVKGRLLVFRGFDAFRDFRIFQRNPEIGVAMSPLDFPHWEVVGTAGGGAEAYSFEPGYVPLPFSAEERRFLAPVLFESYGVLMRIEENADLPLEYRDENSMFARREGLDGKWRDAPLKTPPPSAVLAIERVALPKAVCDAAAKLPVAKNEVWEVDFIQSPLFRTSEPRPRLLYLFAGVLADTGERVLWDKMGVGKGGLKAMWESLAARLLKAIAVRGRIPGEIHLRAQRLARFARPLGMQLPFRMVLHRKLPALETVLARTAESRSV